MLKYLKEAFWIRPEVAGLGRVPVNALLLGAMAALGFLHPGFWLLGLGLEAVYLPAMALHPRFRMAVDSLRYRDLPPEDTQAERMRLLVQLPQAQRVRFAHLAKKCERILRLRTQDADEYFIEDDRLALEKLQWLFLKRLLSQRGLSEGSIEQTESMLAAQKHDLEAALARTDLGDDLRATTRETLEIVSRRLENLTTREEALEQIAGDLARIEAKIDLALEETQIRRGREALSTDIDLPSDMLEVSYYGEDEQTVRAIDRALEQIGREQ